jgi:hypothetical protein
MSAAHSMVAPAGHGDRAVSSAGRRFSLVCSLPEGANGDALHLESLLEQFGRVVRCEVSSPAVAARRCRTWISATQPTIVLLREGEMIAMAIGHLTRLELEQLIVHAIG